MENGLGFYIGDFFVAYYGGMIALGVLAAAGVGYYQTRKFKKSFDDLILLAAVGGLCGMAGAKALYLLLTFEDIDFSRLSDWRYLNGLLSGGFVFYGGLLGGIFGIWICRKVFHISIGAYMQIAVPCIPVAHGFGRIGCSLAGCCYGIPYNGWGAITYTNSMFAPNGQPLFPVQALEACLEFGIAGVLLLYINRFHGKRGFLIYVGLYAAVRFCLEFFRYDNAERGVFLNVSTSQYISLALLAVVFWLFYWERKTAKK